MRTQGEEILTGDFDVLRQIGVCIGKNLALKKFELCALTQDNNNDDDAVKRALSILHNGAKQNTSIRDLHLCLSLELFPCAS